METTVQRLLKPSRVVALALIAVLAAGLVSLRFKHEPFAVAVPRGANVGDLTMEACTFTTAAGDYAADCGTLVVAENRDDPQSRRIALPVTRIRAVTDTAAEPVFRLEGGPGSTNMEFPDANRFLTGRDVVLVGYRGVDGSSRLDCPEVSAALRNAGDLLTDASTQAYADAWGACARRLEGDGVDLSGYTLSQRVDDLDAARVALGYGRIDLVSESAGTRTAMIFAWRHPDSIRRSVMIGANPPGHFLWDGKVTDAQLRHYAELCGQDDKCRRRTGDLAAAMAQTAADMPRRWLFLPIKPGTVRVATFYGLHESTQAAAPLSAPLTLGAWAAAANGDAGGFWAMSMMADLALPGGPVWGDCAAASQVDAAAADAHFAAGGKQGEILGNPGTDFMWAAGKAQHAWPANSGDAQYSRMRTSDVDTLVIGGTLDFTTPPEVATRELMPYLPNGHQVVLAELGHTVDFWSYQPDASSRLVNTFLDSGTVDDSLYTHRTMDFQPAMSWSAIARIAAGSMAALALAAAASFVWMPLRVRRRGGFGPKGAAVLRSVYPAVLGVGSWCLVALVGAAIWPALPLGSETVVVATTGVAVGLGIYWAWVRRDWERPTKAIGLAFAVAAAVAGAWFGFPIKPAPLGLVAAILGATLTANLALIVFDIVRDSAHGAGDGEPVAATPVPTPTATATATDRPAVTVG